MKALLHEAEFYGLSGLVKQLTLCTELEVSGCGDVLFYSYLAPPLIPGPEEGNKKQQQAKASTASRSWKKTSTYCSDNQTVLGMQHGCLKKRKMSICYELKTIWKLAAITSEMTSRPFQNGSSSSVASAAAASASIPSRNQSVRLSTHSRNSSADLSRFLPKGSGLLADIGPEASYVDPLRVQIVRAHQVSK